MIEFHHVEDDVIQSLNSIGIKEDLANQGYIFKVKFIESLEASIASRVCKSELWNVNHMFNTMTNLDFLVEAQPIANDVERREALQRWHQAAAYFEQEIKNLNEGLKQGYSSPQRVVQRVIEQAKALHKIGINDHPFMQLAERSKNPEFTQKFSVLLEKKLLPAIKNYQEYLSNVYLKQARDTLGIHANPNGRACYVALYRDYTSLKRTPKQVFDLGLKTVNKNKKKVIELGKENYKTLSFSAAVAAARSDLYEKFSSADEMHQFYVRLVKRAKRRMSGYFYKMPTIEMKVEAIPVYQQGTGRSAHYITGSKDRDAIFGYDPTTFKTSNFASAEIVTLHEGYPGHHLQIALVQAQKNYHSLDKLFGNSAFSEGWARYAEALGEEAGLYRNHTAKILRRAWPARGMVADTAMHVLGWSNKQVADFLAESGASFAEDPSVLMDRMAILPAQLTSYDSGALEIFALRRLMEDTKGDEFDIKEFHQLMLKNGNIPMALLRVQVEQAIK